MALEGVLQMSWDWDAQRRALCAVELDFGLKGIRPSTESDQEGSDAKCPLGEQAP